MAESPAHRFGQIVGEVLERAVEPLLQDFAAKHGLYLDRQGPRATRPGSKVSWRDRHANLHDLDFVLERGGGPEKIGSPVAFIETAWRRYTKHSRNKAQEIQGAILPLTETFRESAPFAGVVLAGEFTGGALQQLRSHGFQVLFFSYADVVAAFAIAGLDAAFDEATSDREFARRVKAWSRLSSERRGAVGRKLLDRRLTETAEFVAALMRSVTRLLDYVAIVPLHGREQRCRDVAAAIAFLREHGSSIASEKLPLIGYDVIVRYTAGSRIDARFQTVAEAEAFLRKF